ncbi:SDR family oxidoreductase [Hathewaya histolytica]|uniref:3-ketoacyl-ACP reductase n=1 Tax=Hathewaya histolytica TaxID=1498 RepID=A0A4U9R4W7_HATHI|nr:SDR family oxidoreductase [Hathewaya histolytica]VTQ86454.1 3-ketoacyl-ACP reductase [Hathewaya histolytica]
MSNLSGKVVLITGAAKGIGKAIALKFAEEGASVIVNYKKSHIEAEEVKKDIENLGGYAFLLQGDVSEYRTCSNMMKTLIDKFGKIDILINNAAISKIGIFYDCTEECFDEIINTNLKGVFNLTHNAIKYMIPKGSGTIINISSMWGEVGASCEVIYSASKGGINAFTKALGKELAPSNIRVNAISPGVIETSMNSWLSDEEREELVSEIPMMRMGKPEEIANLAVFLASEQCNYMTGQILRVDGGFI